MIQHELEHIKEAEAKARAILQQAGQQKQQILHAAHTDAQKHHHQAIRQAHKEGHAYLDQVARQFAEHRNVCLDQYNDRLGSLKQAAAARQDEAAARIFEGMWGNGNCTDDQFQPDDA